MLPGVSLMDLYGATLCPWKIHLHTGFGLLRHVPLALVLFLPRLGMLHVDQIADRHKCLRKQATGIASEQCAYTVFKFTLHIMDCKCGD